MRRKTGSRPAQQQSVGSVGGALAHSRCTGSRPLCTMQFLTIASPASIGGRVTLSTGNNTPAATGSPTVLYLTGERRAPQSERRQAGVDRVRQVSGGGGEK